MSKHFGASSALLAGLVAGASLLGACVEGSAPTVDLGGQTAPIIGGQNVSVGEYPTVVAVSNMGLCTGTLIHPEWVLTAAHCIDPGILGYSNQQQVTNDTQVIFDKVSVFAGSGGFAVQASMTIPNPGFDGSNLGDDDVGLIKLSQPVTDRVPTPLNRDAAAVPATGASLIQVGYGVSILNNQNSAGVLHQLTAPNTSCNSLGGGLSNGLLLCSIQSDGNGVCNGDSGGPAFVDVGGERRIAGVASFVFPACNGNGAHSRVDAGFAFIDMYVNGEVCIADGTCNMKCGEDPDCPDCAVPADCGDANKTCEAGRCVALPNTPGGTGSVCTDNTECDSALCAGGPDGMMRCVELCVPGGTDCPGGFDCLAAGASGACWPNGGGGDDGGDTDGGDDGGGGPCGCRTGGQSPAPAAGGLAMMLLAGVVLGRRRRR